VSRLPLEDDFCGARVREATAAGMLTAGVSCNRVRIQVRAGMFGAEGREESAAWWPQKVMVGGAQSSRKKSKSLAGGLWRNFRAWATAGCRRAQGREPVATRAHGRSWAGLKVHASRTPARAHSGLWIEVRCAGWAVCEDAGAARATRQEPPCHVGRFRGVLAARRGRRSE
jgi:hypothetical protein